MLTAGKLFVFEGIDGVGKTTLAKAIEMALISRKEGCVRISFPGHEKNSIGQLVYSLHHNSQKLGINNINQASLQLLHVAAHIDAIERNILPALRDNTVVILDRYWWSTWAYGVVNRVPKKVLSDMIAIENHFWQGIRPTAIFYVDNAPITQARKNGELVAAYEELITRETSQNQIYRVDNSGPLEKSIEQITARVLPCLSQGKQ